MEKVRSFIAIELPGEIKELISDFQDKLRARNRTPVKWVDPESIHLTLKFLGNIDTGVIENIGAALAEAVETTKSFNLETGSPGVFPNRRRVRVVWLGLTGELKTLEVLQKHIDSSLVPLGFKAETHEFTPHLTLARVREQATADERQELGEIVTGTGIELAGQMRVDTVNLMKSQLTPGGPIYSRIKSIPLGRP